MFPIVARSSERLEPVPEVLDELPDDTGLAQHLRDGEHEVGGRGSLGQRTHQPEADHLRDEHEIASPSIAASASIPPTPQPRTPSPLTIVVCESVPTSVSECDAVTLVHDTRQELEVDLVDDPCSEGRP